MTFIWTRFLPYEVLPKKSHMPQVSSDEARADLNALIEQVRDSHQPVEIFGVAGSAVLVSQEDWHAIQETIYLLGVPEMRDSIREGMATPLEECSPEPGC